MEIIALSLFHFSQSSQISILTSLFVTKADLCLVSNSSHSQSIQSVLSGTTVTDSLMTVWPLIWCHLYLSFVLTICTFHCTSKYNEIPTTLPESKDINISTAIKLRYSVLSSREWEDKKSNQKHQLPEWVRHRLEIQGSESEEMASLINLPSDVFLLHLQLKLLPLLWHWTNRMVTQEG